MSQRTTPKIIYKIVSRTAWEQACARGSFVGSEHDGRDGYIHFSTAAQVAETAAKHFAGAPDVLLLWVNVESLTHALRWEPSRNGALFPHLYAELPTRAVERVEPLALDARGVHVFPSALES